MTEVSFPTCDQYVECLQSGSGIPVYSGTIQQRGYGVGGLFRRLASGLLPLLPRIGKAVASTALGVVSDKMRGVPCCCLPTPMTLASGGVRCSRLWSTSQLLRPSGQQCSHSGGVCPQIQGRQCGAYVGAVEEMMCVVCVDVTEGA